MKALTTFAALACVVYGIYQIAMAAAEKVFKRNIEPRIKALERVTMRAVRPLPSRRAIWRHTYRRYHANHEWCHIDQFGLMS